MTCTLKNSHPAIKGEKRVGRGLPRQGGGGGKGKKMGKVRREGGMWWRVELGVGMDRYALPLSSGHPAHSNSGAVKA